MLELEKYFLIVWGKGFPNSGGESSKKKEKVGRRGGEREKEEKERRKGVREREENSHLKITGSSFKHIYTYI